MLYFADPMCSWCWGFAPVIDAIVAAYGTQFEVSLVMGGLSPDSATPVDQRTWSSIREHWEHVQELTGQPFDFDFFQRADFVYNTEPACRAVVTVRTLEPPLAASMLRAVHEAFYTRNEDVTDAAVLGRAAAAIGVDAAEFAALFADPATRLATGNDFMITQSAGIRGFPALVVGGEAQGLAAITVGYQPYAEVAATLERWLDQHAGTPA